MAMTGQVFGDGRLFLNYLLKENHTEKNENEENEKNEDNKDNKENKEKKEAENVPS